MGARPGIFSFEGRAKYDAWARAAQVYPTKEVAKSRYLEIARGTGWESGAVPDPDQTDEPTESRGGRGTGLGVSVSVMAQEDAVDW